MAIGDMTLTAVGNLVGDPELRFTASGQAVAEFTIAVNPRERDQNGNYRDGDPSFVSVQVWRQLAENVCESLTKGMRVIVVGRWREERWEKDGNRHSRWRLTADSVGPDLTFATVKVTRTTRRADAPPADPWANGSTTRPAGAVAGQQQQDAPF